MIRNCICRRSRTNGIPSLVRRWLRPNNLPLSGFLATCSRCTRLRSDGLHEVLLRARPRPSWLYSHNGFRNAIFRMQPQTNEPAGNIINSSPFENGQQIFHVVFILCALGRQTTEKVGMRAFLDNIKLLAPVAKEKTRFSIDPLHYRAQPQPHLVCIGKQRTFDCRRNTQTSPRLGQ